MKKSELVVRIYAKSMDSARERYHEYCRNRGDDDPYAITAKRDYEQARSEWEKAHYIIYENDEEETPEEVRQRLNHEVVEAVRRADEAARSYQSELRYYEDPKNVYVRRERQKYEKALDEVKYAGLEAGLNQKQINVFIQNANIKM